MATIKEFLINKQQEAEEAGIEPSLEGSPPGTLSEEWIKWYMTRYRCIREIAILEGELLLGVKAKSLKKNHTPPSKPF